MKSLLSFVFGVIVGAAGLFVWLRQIPHEPPPPVASAAAVSTAPAAPAAAVPSGEGAAAAPAAAGDALAAQLPPAPAVDPDLTEADLPLRPATETLAQVPALPQRAGAPGKLLLPVDGIKPAQLTDTFNQARGKERRHEALDIMAPKGTKVLAAADGKVVKLFTSKRGGLTVYQFDPTSTWAYYYAHLDRYADGVKEGVVLKRGDLVGYVGSTGDASPEAPHLHFAVVALTPEKQWWKGTPINPFPLLVD
jgi:murein DD-endopeptidase MepM/ murein hydrolase activator NlpD